MRGTQYLSKPTTGKPQVTIGAAASPVIKSFKPHASDAYLASSSNIEPLILSKVDRNKIF